MPRNKNKNKNQGSNDAAASTIETKQLGGSPATADDAAPVVEEATTETVDVTETAPASDVDEEPAPVVEEATTEVEETNEGETADEEPAETKAYKVVGDFSTPVKVKEGVYEATGPADAKAQFLKAAGVLSTNRPIKVSLVDDELSEDLSDLF